jgi:hypothetical protein
MHTRPFSPFDDTYTLRGQRLPGHGRKVGNFHTPRFVCFRMEMRQEKGYRELHSGDTVVFQIVIRRIHF